MCPSELKKIINNEVVDEELTESVTDKVDGAEVTDQIDDGVEKMYSSNSAETEDPTLVLPSCDPAENHHPVTEDSTKRVLNGCSNSHNILDVSKKKKNINQSESIKDDLCKTKSVIHGQKDYKTKSLEVQLKELSKELAKMMKKVKDLKVDLAAKDDKLKALEVRNYQLQDSVINRFDEIQGKSNMFYKWFNNF